jgi:hypothetical protein
LGHFGARNTFQKISAHFWWTKIQAETFGYVRRCELSEGETSPKRPRRFAIRISEFTAYEDFIDIVGPLNRTKRGNIAILVIVDGFSKFVSFYPVKKVS